MSKLAASWKAGVIPTDLHQAIEAKENVKVEDATQTYATITLQNYFRMYHKLAGMTGTAETEAGEFWDIYKLDVVTIPTNRPAIRKDYDDLVYKTMREKFNAVIDEIVKLDTAGKTSTGWYNIRGNFRIGEPDAADAEDQTSGIECKATSAGSGNCC